MEYARVKSYAKLNLTLQITGAEGGYHLLDSLVCSVDRYDLITAVKRRNGVINVEMHGEGSEYIPDESNNAYRAAAGYAERFGTRGADIKVYKNIPMGAGMGGSSADAAGALRAMNILYGAADEVGLKALADEYGSDTGYMLKGGFARLTGRGTEVCPLDCRGGLNFVLLLPREGVSTARCYSLYDELCPKENDGESALRAFVEGDLSGFGKAMFNDLYPAAASINPDVKRAYGELCGFSPLGVNMTGSGSGVYALFENAEFCRWAESRYRGKFRLEVLKSVIPKIKIER